MSPDCCFVPIIRRWDQTVRCAVSFMKCVSDTHVPERIERMDSLTCNECSSSKCRHHREYVSNDIITTMCDASGDRLQNLSTVWHLFHACESDLEKCKWFSIIFVEHLFWCGQLVNPLRDRLKLLILSFLLRYYIVIGNAFGFSPSSCHPSPPVGGAAPPTNQ